MLQSLIKDHRGEPRVVAFGVDTNSSTPNAGLLFVKEKQKKNPIVMRDTNTKQHFLVTLPTECLRRECVSYATDVSIGLEKRT